MATKGVDALGILGEQRRADGGDLMRCVGRLLLCLGALSAWVACQPRDASRLFVEPTAAERLHQGCAVPPWDSALALAVAQVPLQAREAWVDAVLASTHSAAHDPLHCEQRTRHAQVLARVGWPACRAWADALETLGRASLGDAARFDALEAFAALQPFVTVAPQALVASVRMLPDGARVRIARAAAEMLEASARAVAGAQALQGLLQQVRALPQAEAGASLVAATAGIGRRWPVPLGDLLAVVASYDAAHWEIMRRHPPSAAAAGHETMDRYLAWVEQAYERERAATLWEGQAVPATFTLADADAFVAAERSCARRIDAPALGALARVASTLGARRTAALSAVAPIADDDRLAVMRILVFLEPVITVDNLASVAQVLSWVTPAAREGVAVLVTRMHVGQDLAERHMSHIPTWLAMLGQVDSAQQRAALVVALGYVGVDGGTPAYILPAMSEGLLTMPPSRRGHFLRAAKRLIHVGLAAPEKLAIFRMLDTVETDDLDAFAHGCITRNGGPDAPLRAHIVEQVIQAWARHGPRAWAQAAYMPEDVHRAARVARVAEQIRVLQEAYPNPPDTASQLARLEAFVRDKAQTTPPDHPAFVRHAWHRHNLFEAALVALRGPSFGGDFPPIAGNEPYPGTTGVADVAARVWHAVENYPRHAPRASHDPQTIAKERDNVAWTLLGALASMVDERGIVCHEGKVQRMLQALEGYFFAGAQVVEGATPSALLRLHGQAFAESLAARAVWRMQACGQTREQAETPTQEDLWAMVGALQAEFEVAWPNVESPERRAAHRALQQWLAIDYEVFAETFAAYWQSHAP